MPDDKPLRILIIEDSRTYMEIIVSMLSKNSLHKAFTASQGISMFKSVKPDIVFLDLVLPDGNGQDVLKEIRKIDEDAFVIIITGTTTKDSVNQAVENKASGYIVKPYAKKNIDMCIEKYEALQKSKTKE